MLIIRQPLCYFEVIYMYVCVCVCVCNSKQISCVKYAKIIIPVTGMHEGF